jgi:hypothetical protein
MGMISIEGILRLTPQSALNRARESTNPLLLGPHPSELEEQDVPEIAAQHLFGAAGTSHLLKYRNMFFLVCTRHQLLTSTGDIIGHPYLLISENSEKMSSCPAFHSIPHNEENPQEFDDLAALTFDHSLVAEHPGLIDRFFPLADIGAYPLGDPKDVWALVGYPSTHNGYDIETDPPTFHRSQALMCGKPTLSGQGQNSGTHAISIIEDSAGGMPFAGDYDGFSGSPASATAYYGGHLFYKGVVITGGNEVIRIIHENRVRKFLDVLVERFN